jgi:uncharacterized NAD-dependent epimerase/dehydratase family protein
MKKVLDGNAIVYCEGAFNTPNGKTAHGLVRFTERYNVLAVIDSRYNGLDAGEVLDKKHSGIPIYRDLDVAIAYAEKKGTPAQFFVMGLAPDGGKLPPPARKTVKNAISAGLHIDSGLHDFISDDEKLAMAAKEKGVRIRDVRKTPPRSELHFFSGEIEKVNALIIALLGTDSAVGKRTTAWILVHALRNQGIKAEMVGTGQTAWMQGAKYSFVLDSLINDFVAGEIEHAVVSAWKDGAEVIVIEGQGSLMNPAYPGGFEILAAGRPDIVVMQHAPARLEYDGFPGYPMHPLPDQIKAVEFLSGKPVVAITVNHEELQLERVKSVCEEITENVGLPAFDVLLHGGEGLVKVVKKHLAKKNKKNSANEHS